MVFNTVFEKALNGSALSKVEMEVGIRAIMSGEVSAVSIASFLTALRVKGETTDEIVAAAQVMRAMATPIAMTESSGTLIDTCGTGGTGHNIFNVSSAVAVVAAAAGATVAKHGNRAASSRTGSADFLEAAGVVIDLGASQVKACIEQTQIGFLFAPVFHGAMKHVAPVRKALGVRTIFNLLGPLTNPLSPTAQVIGVFSPRWQKPLAQVSHDLGIQHALIVHADDGVDEISIAAPTKIVEQRQGNIKEYTIHPRDFACREESLDSLKVADASASLEIINRVFAGGSGAAHDMIVLNAAASIYVAGLADSLTTGAGKARDIIASGAAREKLDEWVAVSQQLKAQP